MSHLMDGRKKEMENNNNKRCLKTFNHVHVGSEADGKRNDGGNYAYTCRFTNLGETHAVKGEGNIILTRSVRNGIRTISDWTISLPYNNK